ncbi:MAG: type I methionyl aminopeptidase [Chloroflexi bacterium]|nr:type I methionyl aminopeptidase [Chloroflexota bacterium]
MAIILKSNREIALMRKAGRDVAEILQVLKEAVKPGISTAFLNDIAEREVAKRGIIASFKGYRGFPASLCTSVNCEIVHGIPSAKRILKEGDIISLDFGVIREGYQGDGAVTVAVGQASLSALKLITDTEGALQAGIAAIVPDGHVGDIGAAVQQYAESRGWGVIREYTGHGIGRQMHEEPSVPNFGKAGFGPVLRSGTVIAIEPMLSAGSYGTKTLRDAWTVVTEDRSLAAHAEHTVAVTTTGVEILTKI